MPEPGWPARLAADLAALPPEAAGSQGRVTVPLPDDRPPTDWERNTAGLADADWITADMAYRRRVLAGLGGFDERFRRAYREDADLALRALDAGHALVRGERRVTHPVRPAGFWASVRAQAGNADDVLMWRVHGTSWRTRAGEGRGSSAATSSPPRRGSPPWPPSPRHLAPGAARPSRSPPEPPGRR